MKIIQNIVIISFLFLCKAAFADQARIIILVDLCNSCHRAGGEYISEIPRIDHLSAKQIKQRMKDYKDGKKDSTIMERISKGFSDRELEIISEYISRNDKKS